MFVVVAYTLLGGFLAVSLTDFVQGVIMFIALVMVPIVAFNYFDDSSSMLAYSMQDIPSWSESMSDIGFVALISSLAWGLGYFGQPHIIVRFMAIDSVKNIKVARRIGMSWMTVTIVGALATGLVGVAYVNKFSVNISDPETIFVFFSNVLFHPLISGFLLAAILAAVMSTISSQLLVSSSSLTEDIYRTYSKKQLSQQRLVKIGRVCVFAVAAIAAAMAWNPSNSILSIVSNAWAGFGAAFGPLILFCLLWQRITYAGALSRYFKRCISRYYFQSMYQIFADGTTISNVIYEMVPGFIVSSFSIWSVSLLTSQPEHHVKVMFDDVNQKLIEQTS